MVWRYNKKKRVKIKANVNNFDFDKMSFIPKKDFETQDFKAIIYCRVSTNWQITQWHWIDTQEEICKEWCNRNWVEIVKVFKDEWISWANLNRKWLNDAMEFLESQNQKYTKIKYFVCTEASRISRSEDLLDTLDVDARIRGNLSEIIYVLQPIDSSTDEWQLIKYIQYVYANYERKKIAKRTINAIRGRVLQWYRPFWSIPVWYIRIWKGKNREIIPDPEKAKYVKIALTKYATWVFINKAQVLDYLIQTWAKKKAKKTGKVYASYWEQFFDPIALYFYAWFVIYPKWEINEPIEWKHKWIISMDVLHKILQKNKESKRWKYIDIKEARSDFDENFPLRGLVACQCCWRKYTGRASKWKSWKYFYYYWCQNKNCLDKPNIWVDKLHQDILDFLKSLTPPKEVWKIFELYLDKAIAEKENISWTIIKQKEYRLKDINNELNEIENWLLKITNNDILKKLEEKRALYNQEKELIIEELKNTDFANDNFQDLYLKAKEIFENPVAIWELWNHELRQLLLGVRTWWIIYYKKNSGVRTPENSLFYRLFKSIEYP